jgi:hypothetical protein
MIGPLNDVARKSQWVLVWGRPTQSNGRRESTIRYEDGVQSARHANRMVARRATFHLLLVVAVR